LTQQWQREKTTNERKGKKERDLFMGKVEKKKGFKGKGDKNKG